VNQKDQNLYAKKSTNINFLVVVVDIVFRREWCWEKGTLGPKFSSKDKMCNWLRNTNERLWVTKYMFL